MRNMRQIACLAVWIACGSMALADINHNYDNLAEGFLGTEFTQDGLTYRDVNNVSGFYPDGAPFSPGEPGSQLIIETATYFYNDFPDYGSPNNSLTFGTSFIPGDNLTIGALASVWMDLDQLGNAVSFDIGYYENGPWGGIEYRLDALHAGQVVGSDSFTISDLGGRDNPTFSTMAISGVEFDQLHLYGWLNGNYTVPRGMIDDLAITIVPEPASLALAALALVLARRRNW